MKEIIFKDTLQKYLVEKISKANNLLCSEEYRAGYIEALNEVILYADFLSINSSEFIFLRKNLKWWGILPCGKSSDMGAQAHRAALFL